MVVHSLFQLDISDAVELLPLLIFSPLLDDPPIPTIIILILFLLFVLFDVAAVFPAVVTSHYLFSLVPKEAVLLVFELLELPFLARTALF